MTVDYKLISEAIIDIWEKYEEHASNLDKLNIKLEKHDCILAAYTKTEFVVFTDEYNMHFKSLTKGPHSFKIETIEYRKGVSRNMPTLDEFMKTQHG